MDADCPFAILGITRTDTTSRKKVLKAWRRKMRSCHSDKTRDGDDTAAQRLNDAKERALQQLEESTEEKGDALKEEIEQMFGIRINEERMDSLWRILTGQNDVSNGGQAAMSDSAKKWMDKKVFREDMFRMMSYAQCF